MAPVFNTEPPIPRGLYEQLISREIARVLNDLRTNGIVSEEEQLDPADSHEVLARYVYEVLQRVLRELPFENRIEQQVAICNHVVAVLSERLDLHDNLLTGDNGRTVNGVGGILLTLLSLTGVVIWWPGIRNWRRSLGVRFSANWRRLTWDLHSAIGFWTAVVVFMFAFTGFYLVFQLWFSPLVEKLEARNGTILNSNNIENVVVWLPRLHFGRFRQVRRSLTLTLKILWVILGLAPAILSVTGVLMWWNRVVRKVVLQAPAEAEIIRSPSLETVGK